MLHHFADRVVEYLKANDSFGMRIEISREEVLLDTGGGLKKTAYFFVENFRSLEDPFILHNVDVISTIDLGRMVEFHLQNRALATLAVQDRESSRYLIFDQQLQLCGRRLGKHGEVELVRPSEAVHALAFSGIHVISPRIFAMMTEEGAFSIVDCHLRLAGARRKNPRLSRR